MKDEPNGRLRIPLYLLVGVFDNAGHNEVELIDDAGDIKHRVHPPLHEEVGARLSTELFPLPSLQSEFTFDAVLCVGDLQGPLQRHKLVRPPS